MDKLDNFKLLKYSDKGFYIALAPRNCGRQYVIYQEYLKAKKKENKQ